MKQTEKARNEYRLDIYDAKVKIAIARWRSESTGTGNIQKTEIKKGQC